MDRRKRQRHAAGVVADVADAATSASPAQAASQALQQLPDSLLTHIILQGGTQRHVHGVLTAVCQEWRAIVLQSTQQLSVGLTSDAGATSLCTWLAQHGTGLQELEMATVGLFGRHCDAAMRLKLFQALHVAAAGGLASLMHDDQPCSSASESDSDDVEAAGPAALAGTAAGLNITAAEASQAAAAATAAAASTAPTGPQYCNTHPGNATTAPDAIAGAAAAADQAAAQSAAAQTAAQQCRPPVQQQQQQHLQLTRLSASMRLTPADCACIASLPAPHLVDVQLMGSRTRRLGIDGVRALATLTQLTSLHLQQLGIGDEAAVVMAQGLPGLVQLSVSGNNIGPMGAAAIAKHCTRLMKLDVSVNRIKAAGLTALCASLHGLKELSLAGNLSFDASSLQHLQQFTALQQLVISSCSLCNQGLAAVAAALPQLQTLDTANNRVSKVDALSGLVSLTSLNLSRNPLQLNCTKVLSGLPLQSLILFDAVSAKAVGHLAGSSSIGSSSSSMLAAHLTSLTLGADPSLIPDGTENLLLAKTRTCSTLLGALAEAGKLRVLSVPCTGMGDSQAKLLSKLGSCLRALNLSYTCVSPTGLRVLSELPLLERLELRAMRPELSDATAANLVHCTRLTLLDLAHNDLTSVGVKQLGQGPGLAQLAHLDLRNNAQVEKWAVLAAAAHLTCLTHLNLLEISDISARARPTKAAVPPAAAAGASSKGATATAAAAAAASPGTAAAGGRSGGAVVGVAGARLHADVWAAFPNLEELLVEGQYAPNAGRGGRVMISCG